MSNLLENFYHKVFVFCFRLKEKKDYCIVYRVLTRSDDTRYWDDRIVVAFGDEAEAKTVCQQLNTRDRGIAGRYELYDTILGMNVDVVNTTPDVSFVVKSGYKFFK